MAEMFFMMIIALIVFIGIAIVVYVFYLKNLQDLLKECDEANLQLSPGNVWLMFIPLFNIVYGFIMYPKISESLKNEFESRNAPQPGDYLKVLGIVIASLSVVGIILNYTQNQSVSGIVSLANLVVFIIYWVKAAQLKSKLRSIPKGGGVRFSDNPDLLD